MALKEEKKRINMELSIIIINYNTKDLLNKCLNSISIGLEDTSILKYETIVVDNASIDDSSEMVRKKFSTVSVIQNSVNNGYAYAVNRGIKSAHGEYILLLNSDIILTHNCLFPMLNYLRNNERTGIVGPQLIYPNGNWQRSYGSIPSLGKIILDVFFISFMSGKIRNLLRKLGYKLNIKPKSVGYIDGASMLIRRELVQEIGYFDERFFFYAEDADFCFRAHKKKWDIVFIPQSQIIHIRGASSVKKEQISFSIQLAKANLQFIEKHYDRISLWIYKVLNYFCFLMRFIKNLVQYIFLFIFSKKERINQQLQKLKILRKLIILTFQKEDTSNKKKK